jgi:hypothetical protein
MDNDTAFRCFVIACASLLQDDEGVVIDLDGKLMLVYNDGDDKQMKIDEWDDGISAFEDASMTGKISKKIEPGTKVWLHQNTVQ